MENLSFVFYIVLFAFLIGIGFYNWIYAKHVRRCEHHMQISLPKFLHQALLGGAVIPIMIAVIIVISLALR